MRSDMDRFCAVLVLVIASMIAIVFGITEKSDPFLLDPTFYAQMEYSVCPFETANRTVTDQTAIDEVFAAMNRLERSEADRAGDMLDRLYELRFWRRDGKLFSVLIWEDALEVRLQGTWRYRADCGKLCEALSDIWHRHDRGEIE